MLLKASSISAQESGYNKDYLNPRFLETDSGTYLLYDYNGICKSAGIHITFVPSPQKHKQSSEITNLDAAPDLIKVHGNISYDFFYRSKTDTPINQNNFQQHTERVYLDILVKDKYPFRVNLIARQSSSPYFRNFMDFNLQFDRYAYRRNVKQEMIHALSLLPAIPGLDSLENAIKDKLKKLSLLQGWLSNRSNLQKLIEEKERLYNKRKQGKPDVPADSLLAFIPTLYKGFSHKPNKEDVSDHVPDTSADHEFEKKYEKKKQEYDSLKNKIEKLQAHSDSLKNVGLNDQQKIREEIYGAKNEKELQTIAKKYNLITREHEKLDKHLSAIKSFSVGRSLVNYTELTAQNITITGVNVEYNPSYYAALTVGKIDFGFRDFLHKKALNRGQYIVLGRVGVGDIEKHALIFTVFRGRKNQSDYAIPDSVNNRLNLMGYSVEAILRKNAYTSMSAEIAKSTLPITGTLASNKSYNALLKFNDKSNLGVNFKGETAIPETNTRFSGFYRMTGENFQSFSLFTYNTDQTAWQGRVDQSFLKRRISLTGMLRQNDFTNPFTDKTFKTSTTFKTLIVNLRFPKYPSISLGYYPGTQLYIIDKEKIRENAYYILNSSMLYAYRYKGINMNSSFIWNQYFNQATDSGFILYKGINYYGSQTLFFKKLQLQSGYVYTKQPELHYYTIEASGDYSLREFLTAGAGVKFNQVHDGSGYWGSRLRLTAGFKRLGSLQLEYEKSYLPTLDQSLYPVEIGRASWFKNF